MRSIDEAVSDIKSILNNIERTEECYGETLVDIDELCDEILTISCRPQKTNADRIRAMSDEELAKMILKLNLDDIDDVLPFCENSYLCSEKLRNDEEIPDGLCQECLIGWLQSKVQEEKE